MSRTIDITRCVIHKRIAEFYMNGKYWCDKCLTEVIGFETAWLYLTPLGEYWLAAQEETDWGEPILSNVPFREAWSKLMELAPVE